VVTFPVSGVYSVACTALFPGGCFSDLTQPIYLTPERVGKSADFTINYTDSFTVLLNGIPVNPSATVKWDLGDGNTTTGTIIKHSYVSGGIYKVCMEYINGKDTQQFCKNVNTLNVNKCKVNYSYITERIVDSLHLSHVVVEWRDAEGNLYSSGKMDQPQTSEFKVLDVEEYALNESGQKTRKLTVQFSCWVSNGFRNIELKNVSGTFAIAHP
jgi:hypothetical protein